MPVRKPQDPPPSTAIAKRVRRKGPMDPPGSIAITSSELARRKHVISGLPPPPLGFARKFQRRPVVFDGGLDERSEVGVLKYEMGNEVVSVSIELDTEMYVGTDADCQIQLFGHTVSRKHLRLYSTSTAFALVCMSDISSHSGYILNGRHFRPGGLKLGEQRIKADMIVLKDGDTIQVPNTPQIITYRHNTQHFPIQPNYSDIFDDYTLFSTTSTDHYIDTRFWRIHNQPLGDGTFGVVNVGTHRTGGVQVAIKTIDSRTSQKQTWRERLDQEVGNMRMLNHPNVMKWLDQIKESGKETDDENEQGWDWTSRGIWKAHLVFELATGGDLFSYQEAKGAMGEDEIKFITWQLVKALDHIHSHEVAHRDIKLENILLHNRSNFPWVLIGDFGFSVTLASTIRSVPSGKGAVVRPLDPAGTIVNLAPERLKRYSKVSKTGGLGESLSGAKRQAIIGKQWFEEEILLDVWALGVVVYHLVAAEHPYVGLTTPRSRDARPSRLATVPRHDPANHPQDEIDSAEERGEKRKFLQLMQEADEEDGDGEMDSYSFAKNTAASWDEYRKVHGEKTLGGADTPEQRLASRTLEDINVFKDLSPADWTPPEQWSVTSINGEKFIASLLSYRVNRRLLPGAALGHPWFSNSRGNLELEYKRAVIERR